MERLERDYAVGNRHQFHGQLHRRRNGGSYRNETGDARSRPRSPLRHGRGRRDQLGNRPGNTGSVDCGYSTFGGSGSLHAPVRLRRLPGIGLARSRRPRRSRSPLWYYPAKKPVTEISAFGDGQPSRWAPRHWWSEPASLTHQLGLWSCASMIHINDLGPSQSFEHHEEFVSSAWSLG